MGEKKEENGKANPDLLPNASDVDASGQVQQQSPSLTPKPTQLSDLDDEDDAKKGNGGGLSEPSPLEHRNVDINKDNANIASTEIEIEGNGFHLHENDLKHGFNDVQMVEVEDSDSPEDGTLAQQVAFMKELETFYRENAFEFKAPKFYGEPLNCLKLWRAVIRLGGYEVVTASKLWRQVGESFHPPKTCTTVSWTFRIFYEKALLEYEKHKRQVGELQLPAGPFSQSTNVEKEASSYQTPGSGRARRDAAARAMQGWHAQRLIGYGQELKFCIKA
uniref:ARID domain-containing protein n=1 Tax=Cannabis sativa TaxID=3483 RepID=A0A803NIC7_CANSA